MVRLISYSETGQKAAPLLQLRGYYRVLHVCENNLDLIIACHSGTAPLPPLGPRSERNTYTADSLRFSRSRGKTATSVPRALCRRSNLNISENASVHRERKHTELICYCVFKEHLAQVLSRRINDDNRLKGQKSPNLSLLRANKEAERICYWISRGDHECQAEPPRKSSSLTGDRTRPDPSTEQNLT